MFGQKLISTLIEIHGMIKNYYILVLVIYYEYIVVVIMIDFKNMDLHPLLLFLQRSEVFIRDHR